MTDETPIETPIDTPEITGLDNVLKTATGEVSEDILKLKEEIAKKYVEELKAKKENGISSLLIGEGKGLEDYLVSKNLGDKIMDNIKGSLLGGLFKSVDQQSFVIGGVTYASVFDYLKPVKEKLDAANTTAQLEVLRSEILTAAAVPATTPTTTTDTPDATAESTEVKRGDFIYPVPGAEINSPVGLRIVKGVHNNKEHEHKGIDISDVEGTPILSIGDGVVESVGLGGDAGFSGYGNYMVVKLTNGYRVLYGHMKSLAENKDGTLRKVDDKIKGGDQVGLMGSTGMSTGPHLHIEIRKGTLSDNKNYFSRDYVDPIAVLPVTKDMVNDDIMDRVNQTAFMDTTDTDENLPMAA